MGGDLKGNASCERGDRAARGWTGRGARRSAWQRMQDRQGRKGLGLLAALVAVILTIPISAVLAETATEQSAEPTKTAYAAGPINARARDLAEDWPPHAQEALALAGLLAIVLGFRASGLARNQARRAAGAEFLGSPREPTG